MIFNLGGIMADRDDHSFATCNRCSRGRAERDEVVAERMDIWKSAQGLINGTKNEWPDDELPSPNDVLNLARFLAGELDGTTFT